jgi:hypothetical protein
MNFTISAISPTISQPFRSRFPGVLAVPYAFRLTSYWAVALLLLVVAFTAFTACLIGEAGKRWKWGIAWG